MRKKCCAALVLCAALIMLTGCSAIGDKSASAKIIYEVTAVISLLMLIGYCGLIRKKEAWFLLLFSSVCVVNIGYLTLSISDTLPEALLANRLAYLGSVCLPMSMFMIISGVCGIKYRRWIPGILLGTGIFVFVIAASPGYLDIYYRKATLVYINGAAVIEKEYGPWHCIYLFYLIAYFAAMIGVIAHAVVKRRINSAMQAVFLAAAVFMNMGVWLLEQLVRIDFEMLSISYIISEVFLLALCLLNQENRTASVLKNETEKAQVVSETYAQETNPLSEAQPLPTDDADLPTPDAQYEYFVSQIPRLTPTERIIFDLYLEGRSTKEIMAKLNIKENTLKYHNKNIYGKLGVSSRKQLVAMATAVNLQ